MNPQEFFKKYNRDWLDFDGMVDKIELELERSGETEKLLTAAFKYIEAREKLYTLLGEFEGKYQ